MLGTTAEFAKTSWLWELEQLTRNGSEWIRFQLQRFQADFPDLPQWEIPAWWETVTLWLILVVLGVSLVLLIEQLWHWIVRSQQQWQRHHAINLSRSPSPPILSAAEWLAQAQREQQQRNFKAACRCLYWAVLRHLQEQGFIPDQPSTTDREYLRQFRQMAQMDQIHQLQPYTILLETHERLCFSDIEISEQDYHRCYQAYEMILAEALIQPQSL